MKANLNYPARLLIWCCGVFVTLFSGLGNAGAQGDDGAGPVVAFRMVCLRHVSGTAELHLAPAHLEGLSEKKRSPGGAAPPRLAEGKLTLPQNNLSPWLRARLVNNQLAFYSKASDVASEQVAMVPSARAVFPAGVPRKVFLLFVPVAAEKSGGLVYNTAVIDADERKFPAGSHLVCNLTRSQIRGRLGQNAIGLNPGARNLAEKVTTDHPRGYFEVVLEQREPAGGTAALWERLARTQWKVDNTARRLCLLFNDPSRGRIAMRTFNEYLIPIEAPPMPIDTRPPPGDGLTKDAGE